MVAEKNPGLDSNWKEKKKKQRVGVRTCGKAAWEMKITSKNQGVILNLIEIDTLHLKLWFQIYVFWYAKVVSHCLNVFKIIWTHIASGIRVTWHNLRGHRNPLSSQNNSSGPYHFTSSESLSQVRHFPLQATIHNANTLKKYYISNIFMDISLLDFLFLITWDNMYIIEI